ncbi:MAG: glycine cleavage system protein GcvH [Kiritimatiellae bacterium]|nr:glycine cleavage system protein GcvH [Kiritimatiellia bacterium]MDD4025638.1 glycine cleavage system protein GcvH [Kiritimatiellia bacterium]MDD4621781.1 glycine cleavage system protein GcvH [Kiritimatiellia bacterium]
MKRYTKDHEWIRIEDGKAFVGISDYAQNSLGDITFVDLPKPGAVFKKGDSLCVIESVKAASDVYAPAGGTVESVNAALADAPEKVNAAAETDGWICALAGVEMSELDGLMDEAQYADFLQKQG